jgi:protein-S-isoprenylcysteine O-methyltransferase Ste14
LTDQTLPEEFSMMESFISFVLWAIWAFIHSFLIAKKVQQKIQRTITGIRFFRILFVITALISFMLLTGWTLAQTTIYFDFPVWIKTPLLISSFFFFMTGARNYDMNVFLGVHQLLEKQNRQALSTEGFVTKGISNYIRHPWYTGTYLLLWSMPYGERSVSMILALCLYLYIGARLEEAKLISDFGQDYIEYKKRVGMFIPRLVRSRP